MKERRLGFRVSRTRRQRNTYLQRLLTLLEFSNVQSAKWPANGMTNDDQYHELCESEARLDPQLPGSSFLGSNLLCESNKTHVTQYIFVMDNGGGTGGFGDDLCP